MSLVQITLKSGAQIEVDMGDFETGSSPLGELTRLKWETPDGWHRKLHTIDVTNIDAIVVIRP